MKESTRKVLFCNHTRWRRKLPWFPTFFIAMLALPALLVQRKDSLYHCKTGCRLVSSEQDTMLWSQTACMHRYICTSVSRYVWMWIWRCIYLSSLASVKLCWGTGFETFHCSWCLLRTSLRWLLLKAACLFKIVLLGPNLNSGFHPKTQKSWQRPCRTLFSSTHTFYWIENSDIRKGLLYASHVT